MAEPVSEPEEENEEATEKASDEFDEEFEEYEESIGEDSIGEKIEREAEEAKRKKEEEDKKKAERKEAKEKAQQEAKKKEDERKTIEAAQAIMSGQIPAGEEAEAPKPEEKEKPPLETFMPKETQEQKKPIYGPKPKVKLSKIYWTAIGILLIILIGFIVALPHKAVTVTTTISPTTTIVQIKLTEIKGCMAINSPGRYYLTHSLNVSLSKGPCINVTSNNVQLIGNKNSLKGSGPYVGVPPFTYAIKLTNVRNVTINGFNLSSFSYGIYLKQTTASRIANSTMNKEIMSGIYLDGSTNNTFYNDQVSTISSSQGGIYISNSTKNNFSRVSSQDNAYYGFVINSTGNLYINDRLQNNPVDFFCNINASYAGASTASNVLCSTSNKCNFVQCSSVNIPSNLSLINLPKQITGCGAITSPGNYRLSKDLDVSYYLNTSNPLSKSQKCINIRAPNVNLNCNNHAVSNGAYGIYAQGNYNITINNCVLKNDVYGVYAKSLFAPKIANITVTNSTYGISIVNSSTGTLSNAKVVNSTYGVYLNESTGISLKGLNTTKNTYGVYIDASQNNVFNVASMLSNKKADVFCAANIYNSTFNQFQSTVCGSTDCNAAPCQNHILPPVASYPISACYTIALPGNYTLSSNIIGGDKCINIEASNVNLNCNSYGIVGELVGSGIYATNQSNVKITNCRISRYGTGINISNVNYATITGMTIYNVNDGLVFANSIFGDIENVNVSSFAGEAGMIFNKVKGGLFTRNKETGNKNSQGGGVLITNSTNNIFSFNNATSNAGYGFRIANSLNNTIFNNSAFVNPVSDFLCDKITSGLYAEKNGVNFGTSKNACRWLVELNSLTSIPTCYAISISSTITLTSDMLYPYRQTCFTVYNTQKSSANNTVINCNYHTVLANGPATFARISNASGVTVQNCFIKNFTNGIVSSGYNTKVINNTIGSANVSVLLNAVSSPNVKFNNITNSAYGVILQNSYQGTITNNNFTNTSIALQFTGGYGYIINNNKGVKGSIGMYLINSTQDTVQSNNFTGYSTYGVTCTGYSVNALSLNRDYGMNRCTNHACLWLNASPNCPPT